MAVDRGGLNGMEGTLRKGKETFRESMVKTGSSDEDSICPAGVHTLRALDCILLGKTLLMIS